MRSVLSGPASAAAPSASNSSNNLTLRYITDGLNFASSGGTTPPDVQFASGPTQEVEFVNLEGEVFNLTGASLGSYYLGTFFKTGTDYLSDPKILYDNESGRWFASILHINSGRSAAFNMLAVSNSSDPTGTWTVYSLPDASGDLGDQPILGLSSSLIGVAVNLFSSTFVGVQFWLVNKSSALAGGILSFRAFGPVASDYSLHPVDGVSSSAALYMVQADPSSSTAIDLVKVTGVPPASPVFTNATISVASYGAPPGAPMPGSSNLLDSGDQRVQSAVFSHGSIWLVLNDACRPSGDTTTRGCIRVVEVNTSTRAALQDFDYGVAGEYLLYPAVAVAPNGVVILVYAGSSSSIYPSVYVTGRGPLDPVGYLAPPVLMRAGSAAMTGGLCSSGSCRFGDYFGAAWSPVGPYAWLAGEFVGGSSATWATAFAEAHYAITPPRPELALTSSASALDVGEAANVSFQFLNSTCDGSNSNHCRVHLPLGTTSYEASCVSPFLGMNTTVSFSASGVYSIGSGGYVAVYPSAGCSGSPVLNLSASPLTVTVHPRPAVVVSASPAFPVDLGSPVTIFAAASGGSGAFSYQWSHLPAGCGPSQAASFTCLPSATAIGRLTVSAIDSTGSTANASLEFIVVPPPTVSLSVSATELETGQTLEFFSTATGGVGNLSYEWNGLPNTCPSGNESSVPCTPRSAATLNVSVTVVDSRGVSVTSRQVLALVVTAPTLTISSIPRTVTSGHALNLSLVVAGGQAPFTYSWSGLPPGCGGSGSPDLPCEPTSAGTFRVVGTVSDSLGGFASASENVTVEAAPSSPGSTASLSTEDVLAIGLVALGIGLAAVVAVRVRRR